MVKNPPDNVGGWGWISGGDREDTLEKEMATHSSILPGESHGQRSLMGSRPWSHKESDTTERLNRTQESIPEITLAQLSGHSCSSSRLTTLGLRTSSNTVRSSLHRQGLPLQVSVAHEEHLQSRDASPGHAWDIISPPPHAKAARSPDTVWDHTVGQDAVLVALHSPTPISGVWPGLLHTAPTICLKNAHRGSSQVL